MNGGLLQIYDNDIEYIRVLTNLSIIRFGLWTMGFNRDFIYKQ